MSIKLEDYVDVEAKLLELGCHQAKSLVLLPQNFHSAINVGDFRQMSEAATVKKLLRAAGLELAELVDRAQRPPNIHNNAADWVAPILFVSSALWVQNPAVVSVALSVIANYLTDSFKGVNGKTIKLDFVVEKTKTRRCTKISYEGDVSGIAALEDILRKTIDE